MIYKIGDKVKIKTWEKMEKEYGLNKDDSSSIPCKGAYLKNMEYFIDELKCNRILIIKNLDDFYYYMEEDKNQFCWSDDMIEHKMVEAATLYEPIDSRFEILDL